MPPENLSTVFEHNLIHDDRLLTKIICCGAFIVSVLIIPIVLFGNSLRSGSDLQEFREDLQEFPPAAAGRDCLTMLP